MDEIARARIGEAHARLLADDRLQFAFPPPRPAPAPPSASGGPDLMAWMQALGPTAQLLLWLLGGLLALALAWLVWTQLRGVLARREPAAEATDPVHAQRQAAEAGALLAEADALAAAGDFGAAIHRLLQDSLSAIGAQRPRLLRPAQTSRDIAGLPGLPDPVREAFGALAAAVERAIFGGRPVDRAGWEACRARYARLTEPAAWA